MRIKLPIIGQGCGDYTWTEDNIPIIREGIELGANYIDTAESYNNGNSEIIIGKAIKDIRDEVIVGSKFSPEHSSPNQIKKALEGSLKRLNTDYIDLYQLHWLNPKVSILDVATTLVDLVKSGKIKYIGVCNLYKEEIQQFLDICKDSLVSVQMEYNLFDRFVEDDILPYCKYNNLNLIAYSPLDQGNSLSTVQKYYLQTMAEENNCTIFQVQLYWLHIKGAIPIPKTRNIDHMRENANIKNLNINIFDIDTISSIFKNEVYYIDPDKIRVSLQGQGNRLAYQTLEEALENKNNNVPSPLDLSVGIKSYNKIKPVRVIKSNCKECDYDLIEGRIRYWAWVIANKNKPIPAYIRGIW